MAADKEDVFQKLQSSIRLFLRPETLDRTQLLIPYLSYLFGQGDVLIHGKSIQVEFYRIVLGDRSKPDSYEGDKAGYDAEFAQIARLSLGQDLSILDKNHLCLVEIFILRRFGDLTQSKLEHIIGVQCPQRLMDQELHRRTHLGCGARRAFG
ncbi:hypothetical protein [Mesorhizobium sp. 113-1-2]|uniref:hypothetical protein n=1 Tax=Mesorhizobium sp. 113-1-2 TaxID=2744515 RepID=UPI001927B6B5|nr:hypothetical protein [Mesorhizobium sp. 113-1-2]